MSEEKVNENITTDSNLIQYVHNFFEMVTLYDDNKNEHQYKDILEASIDVFLQYQSEYTAYEVYENFFMIYQITPEDKSDVDESSPTALISEPNTLLDLVKIMKKYEENTGDLIDRQRDHFIHSVNVFILGLAIYAQNKNYRDIFKNYIERNKENYEKYYKIDDKFSHEEFLYRWGVASLFHDIGYPFEIIGKQLKKFINEGVKPISDSYDINVTINFRDFDEFNTIVKLSPYDFADNYREKFDEAKVLDLFKPTEIMAHKIYTDFELSKTQFRALIKRLNGFINYMIENDFIDHGFFSAILVLNSYGSLIQKYTDKNNGYFFYPIVDSATAILLHNFYDKTLRKQEPFELGKFIPKKSPIAYLLILCDELQEWNRQPYGVLDKKKSHVNDLDVTINDGEMKVKYIVNKAPMGLGFEEDKELLIKNLLDIKPVFNEAFSINPQIELDNVLRDISMAEIQAPDVLMRNIENLAELINTKYYETTKANCIQASQDFEDLKNRGDEIYASNDKEKIKEYEEEFFKAEQKALKSKNKFEAAKKEFKDLNSDLKISNIRQAKSIPKKLAMIGCEIAHISDDRKEITEFSENEIKDLAIFEHNDWMNEREGMGWVYGEEKDIDRRISPYLVSWDELDEDTKKYDEEAIKNIPDLLNELNLKVVESRIKSLTHKMHEFFVNEIETSDEKSTKKGTDSKTHKDLPLHIQYSNYKQANYLVKILKEKKYELVELNDPRKAESKFDDDDIEYFAKREHQEWYKIKVNLGFKYAPPEEDVEEMEFGFEEFENSCKEKLAEAKKLAEINGEISEESEDEKPLTNPNLVKWECLPKEIQERNKETFRHLSEICADESVGLKIVKSE